MPTTTNSTGGPAPRAPHPAGTREAFARPWRLRARCPLVGTLLLGGLIALSSAASAKNWTVLAYLNADGPAAHQAGLSDLQEMERVGSSTEVDVVVQWDGWAPALDTMGGSGRYVIYPNFRFRVQDLNEVNMGQAQTLADFVTWGIANFPADHYALIIGGRGDGWRAPSRAAGMDQTDGSDQLLTSEIRTALEQVKNTGHTVDLIGIEASLNGMLEVAYELRSVASILTASETQMPSAGYPYHTILQDLIATPTMSAAQLANVIVDRYGQYFATTNPDATLSALNLNTVGDLTASVSNLASTLMANWDSRVNAARSQSQSFSNPDHVDLYHFADLVRQLLPSAASAASAVQAQIQATVANSWNGQLVPDAHGLALYFPASQPTAWPGEYTSQSLAFPDASLWDEFLGFYYDVPPTAPFLNTLTDTQVGTSYNLGWSAAADSDGVASYALQQTTQYETAFGDDAEGTDSAWLLSGFSLSSSRFKGGAHSYHSGLGNNLENEMRVTGPTGIPAGKGATLSFWVSYEIESGVDYGYAEISTDGNTWLTLAGFTGTQPLWTQYQFDLSAYAGQSLWVRFRYVTDAFTYGAGLFVDDLKLDVYQPFTSVSAAIGGLTFVHPGQTNTGIYYYRVRAKDSRGKPGLWSNLQSINVSRPPIDHLTISPNPGSVVAKESRQFTAVAYDADNHVIPGVTFFWSVVNGGGSVSTDGIFTAGSVAATYSNTLRAQADGKSDLATVTVTPAALKSLVLSPSSAEVKAGKTQDFTVKGYDQYGNAVTGLAVTWSVVNGGGTMTSNTFTAQTKTGSFSQTVQAESGGVKGLATVNVVADELTRIEVTPNPGNVNVGQTLQFTATGYDQYDNVVTGAAFTWSLADGGTVSDTGLVQAAGNVGTFTDAVSATSGGLVGKATLVVNSWYTYAAGKQLLTVPTTLSGLDAATLLGTQKLARWNAATGAFELYGSRAFNVTAGEGYAANLPQATTVQVPGAPPTGTVELDLSTGTWHLVGNPFGLPLEWNLDTLQFIDSRNVWNPLRSVVGVADRPVEFYGWKYSPAEGSYRLVCGNGVLPTGDSRLDVGQAAWIYTGSAGVRLRLALPARSAPSRQQWTPSADNWAVELIASVGSTTDRSNLLGVTSQFGRGGLNLPAPPATINEQFVDLALAPANRSTAPHLAVALASGDVTRATWDAAVTTNAAGQLVTLTWPDLSQLPARSRLRLVDLASGQTVSMRTSSSYTYRASGAGAAPRRFQVELTPAWDSALRLSSLTVTGSRGRAARQVSFALSGAADVRWQLRSAAGRGVSLTGALSGRAGLNTFSLDLGRSAAGSLPAGVYLLELVAQNDEQQTVRAVRAVSVR